MTGNNWAIVVGINEYTYHAEFKLNYAVSDAQLMRSFLCDYAGFAPKQVLLCLGEAANREHYPTSAHLFHLLERVLIPECTGQIDRLWFFFAGHGLSRNGQDYLLTADSQVGDIDLRFVLRVEELTALLRRHQQADIVLILDNCRTLAGSRGTGTPDEPATSEQTLQLSRERGITTIFGCGYGQASHELSTIQQGAFTYALVEGLKQFTLPITLEAYLQQRVWALNTQANYWVAQTPHIEGAMSAQAVRPLLPLPLSSQELDVLLSRATQAEQKANLEEAMVWWQKVIELAPLSQQGQAAQQALEQLREQQKPPLQQSRPPNQAAPASLNLGVQSARKGFFISYNRHDKQWAEWIAWTLEEKGYTVIVEAWDFQPGGNFALYMDRAVQEAKQTIAVLSQHFLEANYVHLEWAAAFKRDPQSFQRTLIPVRVGECQPEGLLAQIVYVDLVGVPEAEAKQRLLDGLKERAKPDQPPSFPGTATPKAERVEPDPVAFPGTEATVEPEPEPELGRKLQRALPVLTPFSFEVSTVDQRGQVVNRKQRQAQSFKEDLGNRSELEMVSIPGGRFLMGSSGNSAETDEQPEHYVTVQPFFIGRYTVTQAQWKAVAALPKLKHDLKPSPSGFEGANYPVNQVSWDDAIEFCDRLSRQTSREYRLPSEAEWEYACRAGTKTPFHFGKTLSTELANYDKKSPTYVGRFSPNNFGLCDMHGNVEEWCLDHWHNDYVDAPSDGSAWVEGGDADQRLLRGGSWDKPLVNCRSASRSFLYPFERKFTIGFRVVCCAM